MVTLHRLHCVKEWNSAEVFPPGNLATMAVDMPVGVAKCDVIKNIL